MRTLTRLCRLADLLCLDVVVDTRRRTDPGDTGLGWDVLFGLPGAPVPDHHARAPTLTAAVAITDPAQALRRLTETAAHAPAHWLVPRPIPPPAPVEEDLTAARLTAAANPGAQAIWRAGAWWHTPLRHDRSTGWSREYEPPPPPWLGEPIGHHRCPDCAPDAPRTCVCAALLGTPDPACPLCHGTGTRTWAPPCPTCAGTTRIHHGTVVTITDLHNRVRHVNWRPDHDRHFTLEGATRDGAPGVRVGTHLRLTTATAGFDTCHLTDLTTGATLPAGTLDGRLVLHDPTNHPVDQYLADASRSRPAARILIHTAGPLAGAR